MKSSAREDAHPDEVTSSAERESTDLDDPNFLSSAITDLRRMAANLLSRERVDHTLQPTALVNELYVRLTGERFRGWRSRAAFFQFAGRAMRWILVDHARRRGRGKRALPEPCDLPAANPEASILSEELIDLDRALEEMSAIEPRRAKVVELRYFVGLTYPEIASALEVSLSTVQRDWLEARDWLESRLGSTVAPAAAQSEAGQ